MEILSTILFIAFIVLFLSSLTSFTFEKVKLGSSLAVLALLAIVGCIIATNTARNEAEADMMEQLGQHTDLGLFDLSDLLDGNVVTTSNGTILIFDSSTHELFVK